MASGGLCPCWYDWLSCLQNFFPSTYAVPLCDTYSLRQSCSRHHPTAPCVAVTGVSNTVGGDACEGVTLRQPTEVQKTEVFALAEFAHALVTFSNIHMDLQSALSCSRSVESQEDGITRCGDHHLLLQAGRSVLMLQSWKGGAALRMVPHLFCTAVHCCT